MTCQIFSEYAHRQCSERCRYQHATHRIAMSTNFFSSFSTIRHNEFGAFHSGTCMLLSNLCASVSNTLQGLPSNDSPATRFFAGDELADTAAGLERVDLLAEILLFDLVEMRVWLYHHSSETAEIGFDFPLIAHVFCK